MKRAMILIIFIFLISSVGCRSNKGCVSEDTAVSEITDAEKISADTVDTANSEQSSSLLCAPSAQGSSAENSNIAKPNKTVSQIREQPKTSSAAPSNTDTAQTLPEIKPETPANATESDTKAVADRVIYHLNRARVNIGSRELKRLPRLTGYAEYRSSQLPSNFAHDISDWFAAAKATGYGNAGRQRVL